MKFSFNGQPLYHYMGCSTFSNFTVLPEIAVDVEQLSDARFRVTVTDNGPGFAELGIMSE